jgi:hypothetical protein
VRLAGRTSQINESCRLLLAAGLLVALTAGHEVSAASVSSTRGITAARHDCKCATKCRGESCCCGPHAPHTPLPAPESTPEPDRVVSNPCLMNAAPCRDSGLPSAPSDGPVSKCASLVIFGYLRLDTVGSLLPFSTHSLVPHRRFSRLDRPPEGLIFA